MFYALLVEDGRCFTKYSRIFYILSIKIVNDIFYRLYEKLNKNVNKNIMKCSKYFSFLVKCLP